eukprot:CAMPEP_0178953828 /NCGR_PEP_ID=MMETSP0789-20121207/8641_1 /TAXON_ID=3005 /ORGANISM="Rhizosolenia setigera, Strain CCMP 1694" /LENGTH=184 /DNA_ID=CAMNT_0020635141 /DNA_START=246 /DNA_END=801 /DNA_ORIENTATION=+
MAEHNNHSLEQPHQKTALISPTSSLPTTKSQEKKNDDDELHPELAAARSDISTEIVNNKTLSPFTKAADKLVASTSSNFISSTTTASPILIHHMSKSKSYNLVHNQIYNYNDNNDNNKDNDAYISSYETDTSHNNSHSKRREQMMKDLQLIMDHPKTFLFHQYVIQKESVNEKDEEVEHPNRDI